MKKYTLIIILVYPTLFLRAQDDFRLSLVARPNYKVFTDVTPENLGISDGEGWNKIESFILPMLLLGTPEISLKYQLNSKFVTSLSYVHISNGYQGKNVPGFCAGILPAFRNIDKYALEFGYRSQFRKLHITPSTGFILQHGSNTYGSCNSPNPRHGFIILDRIGYKKLGVIGRVDIEKHFPSKDKKRIGQKRYLVGFNFTYNYLPNEVNHFSTGFHIGINALTKKENGRWKF